MTHGATPRANDATDTAQRVAERVVAEMLEHDAFSRWLGLEGIEIEGSTAFAGLLGRAVTAAT